MTVKAEKTEWLCRNICKHRNHLVTPTANSFVVTNPPVQPPLCYLYVLTASERHSPSQCYPVWNAPCYPLHQSTPHSLTVHLPQLGTTCQGQHTLTHAQLRDSSAWTSLQAGDETHARELHSPGDGTQAESPCLPGWNCRKTLPWHAAVPLESLSRGCCHHSAGGSICASAAGFALGRIHQDRSTQKLQIVYNKWIDSASHRLPCCQISVGLSPALKSTDGYWHPSWHSWSQKGTSAKSWRPDSRKTCLLRGKRRFPSALLSRNFINTTAVLNDTMRLWALPDCGAAPGLNSDTASKLVLYVPCSQSRHTSSEHDLSTLK